MQRRTILCSLAALTLLGGLTACGSDDADPADTTAPADTATGLANPASVFCVDQGGAVDIVDEADGQVGYCVLPDGTRVDEWEYYRAESGVTTEP